MSQTTIRSVLMQALATYANAHSPILPISREGVPFTKPVNNGTFLETFFTPANTVNITTDGIRKRFLGEFQINVWVADNIGVNTAETIANEIANLFPVVPKSYLPISIEQTPSIKKSIYDPSGYRVTPVCVSYRMEA